MRLVAMTGGQTLSFPLRQGSTLIGRHATCHICIPSKSISRRHCQCYVDGPNVSVRDLGSSHGTLVNGRRIERADLHHGDVLTLGSFDLRFDSEGAAPSYGHGAGAAEDIVVTAGPAGMAVPGGPQPGAQMDLRGTPEPLGTEPAPPAPTDFPSRQAATKRGGKIFPENKILHVCSPESPTGEETPADQTFMPAPYVPRQETVLGPADQPQLVVREGRWFLRDPRTGREVEIAPTGGAGAIAARPAELRRPNVRLLITVVAIAAIVVITFAAVILRPASKQPPVQGITNAAWAQLVDAGIEEFKKGDYAQANAKFTLAAGKRSDLEPARLLTQYTLLRQAAGENFRELNKTEARHYLDSIEQNICPSEKAIAFAREQRQWIDRESVALAIRDGEAQRIKQVGENEDSLNEIRARLLQIPPERFAAKLAKEDIAEIDRTIFALRMRLARREMELGQPKWAEAIPHLDAALQYAPTNAEKAAITKQIEDCRRYAGEAQLVQQAKDALNNKQYGAARSPLTGIKPGYYHKEAQRILADIARLEKDEALETVRQQVGKLYKTGAGPQAAELADQHKLQEFAYIRERVKRIEDLLALGKKADEEEKDYRKAEDAYQEAVGVEPDAENAYHVRAQRALDAIKARYPEFAAEAADKGYPLIHKDPAQARKWFEQAKKYDANNERAKKGLASLERQASNLLNAAAEPMRKKMWMTAKEILERARDSATPGTDLYQRIMQRLEEVLKHILE
ncbi:MAG: FHA domain-containing protein [Planctomycetes bacterium]|nr:FHA domain-containing protein [Planctomycetota bacterium]